MNDIRDIYTERSTKRPDLTFRNLRANEPARKLRRLSEDFETKWTLRSAMRSVADEGDDEALGDFGLEETPGQSSIRSRNMIPWWRSDSEEGP